MESKDHEKVGLKKELRLHHLVSIGIGGLIGSGIFVSPVGILSHAGSIGASLFVWAFCGVCQIFFALCYAELGCRIPLSGSEYIFFGVVFGGFMACVRLWSEVLLLFTLSMSVYNRIFAMYVVQPFYDSCDPPDLLIKIVYTLAVVFIVAVNCFSVKLVARIQVVFTSTKLAALCLVIVLGIVHMITGDVGQLRQPFTETNFNPTAYPLAFYSGVWALSGWEYVCFVIGEIKNPQRDLRLSLMISMTLTTVVYMLANVAYAVVLSKDEMLASPAVAVAFARKTMGRFALIMPFFVALSVLGSSMSCILAVSRMFYMAAQRGHLPVVLSLVSIKWRTPVTSLLFLAILAVVGITWDNVIYLMELTGFLQIMFYGLTIAALIYLRRTDPKPQLPIVRAPVLVPEFCFLVLLMLFIMTIYRRPVASIMMLLIMLICFSVIYMVCVHWKNKPQKYFKLRDEITMFTQKMFLSVPGEQ